MRAFIRTQPGRQDNPTGCGIMRQQMLLTWVMLIGCCCCCEEMWEGIISTLFIEDVPVHPMPKEIRREALTNLSFSI